MLQCKYCEQEHLGRGVEGEAKERLIRRKTSMFMTVGMIKTQGADLKLKKLENFDKGQMILRKNQE